MHVASYIFKFLNMVNMNLKKQFIFSLFKIGHVAYNLCVMGVSNLLRMANMFTEEGVYEEFHNSTNTD